jgi:hypothetical protein
MFYVLFSFKKKLNLCQGFVGQGFSLAFFFLSPFTKWELSRILSTLITSIAIFTKKISFHKSKSLFNSPIYKRGKNGDFSHCLPDGRQANLLFAILLKQSDKVVASHLLAYSTEAISSRVFYSPTLIKGEIEGDFFVISGNPFLFLPKQFHLTFSLT